jgi:serine/threonine-protein kinase
MIGTTLGHYTLLEEIGAGGMGRVYRAMDERLEREVAIKILPAGALADAEARKRFRKEALALSKLNHPNIATVHDFDRQDETDFLVMEHIEGATLAEKLAHGALPEKDVLRLGLQLAEGLAGAHAHGVLHRDLKPSNVRVTPEGRLKILDFGLAKLLPQESLAASTESESRLAAAGTLPYMSPEQVLGEKLDGRSDIYSAGDVLYEMATGRRPFEDEQPSRLIDDILHQAPVAPRAVQSRVSPQLESVILKCLEKDPENRYQSAGELAVDLRRLATAGAGSSAAIAPRPRTRARAWWMAAAVVVLVLAAPIIRYAPRLIKGGGSAAKIQSLAVLPFENLSGDPAQEYFADGITDELTSRLARSGDLRVISRTSAMQYKGAHKPLPEIARELGVEGIVEGTVMRAGDQVRITTELVRAASDEHLWTESYRREVKDILQLQEDVAEAISAQVRVKLSAGSSGAATRAVDPRAYEAYLRGRFEWSKRTAEDVRQALAYFQGAITLDPNYAAAYSGLADCYLLLQWRSGMPSLEALGKAREAGLKALALDPSLAEAHATLAQVSISANWDWKSAEAEFKRAIERNPNYATAHHWYGLALGQQGRTEEAKRELERARELDPLPPINQANVAWAYYVASDYDRAIAMLREIVTRNPDFWVARWGLGSAYVQKGEFADAIRELERARQLSRSDPGTISSLGYAEARAGNRAAAESLLRQLQGRSQKELAVSPGDIALIYTGLGERKLALDWLEKGYSEHSHDLLTLRSDPWWDSLRDESRFQQLLSKIGLSDR